VSAANPVLPNQKSKAKNLIRDSKPFFVGSETLSKGFLRMITEAKSHLRIISRKVNLGTIGPLTEES
jgi:hypothetical protein